MKSLLFLIFSIFAISANAQNVGIGTTVPYYPLHLHSNTNTLFTITNGFTGQGPGSIGGRFELSDSVLLISNMSGPLEMGTKGSSSIFISQDIRGFVGINNNKPLAALHISSYIDNNEAVRVSGSTPFMSFYDNGIMKGYVQAASSGFELGAKSTMPINFYTNNLQRMSILPNGNIGIGETSPAYPVSILAQEDFSVPVMHVKNAGTGAGIFVNIDNTSNSVNSGYIPAALTALSKNNPSIIAEAEGSGIAVWATSFSGNGIKATSILSAGVYGMSNFGVGVMGRANGSGAVGGKFSGLDFTTPALEIDNGAIKVSGINKTAFQIKSTVSNILGNLLVIPNTTLANEATDLLYITPVFDPVGGVYCNFPIGVWWNGSNWTIFNQQGVSQTMPVGAVFNVLVIKQ